MTTQTEVASLEVSKPFRILNKNKDQTVFKKGKYNRILIYFHDLKQWINPPTDSNIESRIIRDINRNGVEYLGSGEEL